MADLEGGCRCGAVRYRAGDRPFDVTHCHCVDCRRSSAAPFMTWFSVAAPSLVIMQGTLVRHASSPGVERTFCGRCGTPLTYRRHDRPDVDVTACSLDDPAALAPEDHIFTQQQVPWVRLADGLPRHAGARPPVVA
ncbi:MAG TPA: GFA family protein [Candidatus Binatia bacterium]|jgi:hypothetical protein|nr:GFA family protein [Candidatus Binatia bacterium]